jgi:archaellum component FlaC
LKDHLEELQQEVDNFHDGSTNWKEIVANVESKTSELQTEGEDIDNQAEELSSHLDSFFAKTRMISENLKAGQTRQLV